MQSFRRDRRRGRGISPSWVAFYMQVAAVLFCLSGCLLGMPWLDAVPYGLIANLAFSIVIPVLSAIEKRTTGSVIGAALLSIIMTIAAFYSVLPCCT